MARQKGIAALRLWGAHEVRRQTMKQLPAVSITYAAAACRAFCRNVMALAGLGVWRYVRSVRLATGEARDRARARAFADISLCHSTGLVSGLPLGDQNWY